MSKQSNKQFDIRAYWRSSLGADPRRVLQGFNPPFSVFSRLGSGDHVFDLIDIPDASLAVLDRSLFDAFKTNLDGQDPSRESFLSFVESIMGAELETDNLLYSRPGSLKMPPPIEGLEVRSLTANDQEAFNAFNESCPAEDLEAAFVELDHDIVVGAFHEGTLVCKASAFPFFDEDEGDDTVWDIGYATLPAWRGRGYGKACAAYLASLILEKGMLPQIRSTDQRPASLGIARSLGFEDFGRWSYPMGDE